MTTTSVPRNPAVGHHDFDVEQLKEQVTAAMERYHVPGVALGIINGDQEYMVGFGVTNIDHPLPVDADTLFQIGSTTKTITGTAAMRLMERGKLDLDQPVCHYLPYVPLADQNVANHVTLRHLFSHTGGWVGDYFDDTGRGDDALANIVNKMVDLPQLTSLGEVWSYNNAGFYLAGRVLEVVADKPYEEVAQELVLDPLGMTHSFFFAEDAITYRVAVGHDESYTDHGQGPQVARPWAVARSAHAVGGLISSVRDQVRYAHFHLGDGRLDDGTQLLTSASMSEMQFPRVAAADGQFFGVTWFVRDIAGTRIVRHGGATNGQLSAFILVPSQRFAITVLANAERGGELNRDVTAWALDHYLGLRETEPEQMTVAPEALVQYVGRYTSAGSEIELSVGEGGLRVQVTPKGHFPTPTSPPSPTPPPVRGALCNGDCIVLLDDPMKGSRGEFLRRADGHIVWLRFGGRVHRHEGERAAP